MRRSSTKLGASLLDEPHATAMSVLSRVSVVVLALVLLLSLTALVAWAATNDVVTTPEDTPVRIDVAFNDAESPPRTVYAVTQGVYGTVVMNADNTVTYTPFADYNGTDEFMYGIKDVYNAVSTATVTVTVTTVADIVPDIVTILEDTAVTIPVLANDTFEGDPHVTAVTQGTNGGVVLNLDNTATYTPSADYNGTDTFTYTVTSPAGVTENGTVTVNVTPVNDIASFTAGPAQEVYEDCGLQSVAWATVISAGPANESGQALNFIVTNDNPALFSVQPAISSGGTLTYTPAVNINGSATATVSIHDNGGTANGGLDTSATQTFLITVTPVNDAPSFAKGLDQTVLEDWGAQTVAGWATAISAGPANESGQALHFDVTVTVDTTPSLFSTPPAISANGTLTYTPAADANGSATVSVTLTDDATMGGAALTTSPQTFIINVTPVNDRPSFTAGSNDTVLEDCSPRSVVTWATNIDKGADNEWAQTLNFIVTNSSNALFLPTGQPAISPDGTLTYTPAPDMNGSAIVTVGLHDNDDTANGGLNTSVSPFPTFTITVTPVNDAPSFAKGADQTVLEDCGAQTVAAWATAISAGPANESGQVLHFDVTGNTNSALFSAGPAISSDGTLTYTPAADANGAATVTINIHDDGGTADSGVDTSASQTFVINVTPVNDVPFFTKGADQTVLEDCGPRSVALWATGISAGAANESSQVLTFIVTNVNNALFAAQPAVAANGTLTYTPAANMNGTATVTVILHDDGGTLNDGHDTSASQQFTITVTAVNDVPSFTKGANQTALEDGGIQIVDGWATALSKGPPDESDQTLNFIVTNDKNTLFAVQPVVSAVGSLIYTPAADMNGSSIVTVILHDNGGTANGGVDTSAAQTFTITVTPVADIVADAVTTLEDTAITFNAITGTNGASADNFEHAGRAISAVTQGTHGATVTFLPNGSITYIPLADYNGTESFTYTVTSPPGMTPVVTETASVTVTVTPVADIVADAVTTLEDTAITFNAITGTNGASADNFEHAGRAISAVTQGTHGATVTFLPNGSITYIPLADYNGTESFTYTVTSPPGMTPVVTETASVTLTITPVNDIPFFTKGADQTVLEDCGLQTVAAWATGISAGAANESSQALTFTATNSSPALFSIQPALSATGTLTYVPAPNAYGTATVTVTLTDDATAGGPALTTAPVTFTITITPVNDAPSFTGPSSITVFEDSGTYSAIGATAISTGAANEVQLLDFIVTNDNTTLFSTQPSIAPDGTLTFAPAADANGITTVTVRLHDNGGTLNGGVDTSAPQTFTITILYRLTVTTSPSIGGTVTIDPDLPGYLANTSVTLTATPALGYYFTGWSGDMVYVGNAATFDIICSMDITANFALDPLSYTLSTTSSPSLGGTIAVNPVQAGYVRGSVVSLTATPAPDYYFTGWSGSLTGMTNPATMTMHGDANVTANFQLIFSLPLPLTSGWNLISSPVALPVASIPGFQAGYGYHDGWSVLLSTDSLAPGEGYWIQVEHAVVIPLTGTPGTVPVPLTYEACWQLIGNPFDVPLPISSITNHELITDCYSYGPTWEVLNPATDSLQPGKGYWIQVAASATLTLIHP